MTDTSTYTKADFEFDFFMATVRPAQFSEFEWRVYQVARRDVRQYRETGTEGTK